MKLIFSIFLLFLAFSACKTNQFDTELARWQSQADRVTIIRDDFGVPHIYGKTDADAVFGLLYAQCEDDFPRVERNYIWAIGRLAEVEGEGQLYSDLRARLFMTEEEAKANYEKSPDWLKKLCVAFADGVNFYLHSHPEVKPKLLTHFEPWYPMYFSEGSIGGDIEQVSLRGLRAFYEEKEGMGSNTDCPQWDKQSVTTQLADAGNMGISRSTDCLSHWRQSTLPDDEPRGSNGFAISGKLTASGNAMLLINPHTSFYFRPEVHVVSEEGLNAYGAVTWGQFFVYQGFNEKTGWMHTSSYADVIDEYLETVTEENGKFVYQFGQEKRPVIAKQVTLKYKEGDQMKERKFPIYRTHHGPITHKIPGKDAAKIIPHPSSFIPEYWVSTAMMWDPVNALIQSYTRTKQSGHRGFREMMNIRTNSSNNTVYADAEGNIAYYHGNFIPKRDQQFDFSKPVDGSNPATGWQGLHAVDECIVVVNPPNGWLQNCNSTPFTCAGSNSPKPEDFPVYMRLPSENFRGIHAVRLLEKGSGYTLDKLIEIAYDPYLPGFEKLVPGLVKAFDDTPLAGGQGGDPTIKPAIEVLRKWDFKVTTESVAMTLAHYYGNLYERLGKVPDDFTNQHLGDMGRIHFFGTGSPPAERLAVFKQAVQELTADFGRWDLPWGEVNRFQRLTGDIVQPFDDSKPSLACGLASGKWGALASFGARQHNGSKRIYGTSGNSFVAVVEFGPKLKAKSLLAGGQSGDPKSPHFYDQAQRYVDAQFKDVAFYREDVEKRAKRTYHPGVK